MKNSVPNDAQDFSFTAGGGLSPASFDLDDDSDATLVQHPHVRRRAARQRVLHLRDRAQRVGPDGATCDDGSSPANISVSVGETVTCTFTNRKRGPDRGREGRAAQRRAGLLVHGRRRPLAGELRPRRRLRPDTRQLAHVHRTWFPAAGTPSPRPCPAGWDQTAATCDDGSPVSNVAVAAGETVTCTFQNSKRGQISITKDAIPDDAAGLRVHGRRRALTRDLLARRRPQPHAVEHARVRGRAGRLRLLRRRDRARRLGPVERDL